MVIYKRYGCVVLYILNLLDLVFTLNAIAFGGMELNPLMKCVPVMVFYKIVIVGALCLWLSKQWEQAKKGVWLCLGVYAMLVAYHIVMLLLAWL